MTGLNASKKRKRKKRKKNNTTLSTQTQDMVTINKDSTETLGGIAGSSGAVKLNTRQKNKLRQTTKKNYKLFVKGIMKQQLDQKQAESSTEKMISHNIAHSDANTLSKGEDDRKYISSSEVGSVTTATYSRNAVCNKRKHEIFNPQSTGSQTQVKADLNKKLLILDVNGVLAHVVYGKINGADHHTLNYSIFKRPHLDSFWEFCFERFNVGIWSTKYEINLLPVVEFLLPNFKEKLLFIWDGLRCTKTNMKTIDNNKKPIKFKYLGKFWESNGPCKSWVKGDFYKSNTLLVDDSPYKALLNPKNTAIFPPSYNHQDEEGDDFLGTNGSMRGYLEGGAKIEYVQMHVHQHPFGQPAIDEIHQHWDIYKKWGDQICQTVTISPKIARSTAPPSTLEIARSTAPSPTTTPEFFRKIPPHMGSGSHGNGPHMLNLRDLNLIERKVCNLI